MQSRSLLLLASPEILTKYVRVLSAGVKASRESIAARSS
jgi:hypothetical protein